MIIHNIGIDISTYLGGGSSPEPPVPPVNRDIHATYNFVANTPTKVYDEYDVTAVTDATYTIDDGTQTYTGSTLEFGTDGEHTLHFVSEGNHTWARMFSGCTELTSLALDSSVTGVSSNTCRYCSRLTDVSMPGAQTIEASTFQNCNSLTGFTFPAAVTIGNLAFSGTKPTGTLTIPKTTTSIGASAFSYTNYSVYDALVFETGRTQTLKIGNYAFRASRMRRIESAPEIDFSSGTNIFRECNYLTGVTGYNVPTDHPHESNTRAIRGGCFQDCTNLVSFNPGEGKAQVNLPEGIEKLGPSAFSGCTKLYSIDLPASLNNSIYKATLDVKAPLSRTSVATIISRSAIEPPVSGTSFTGMSTTGVLYTPTGADYSTWLSYLGPGWTQDSIDNVPGEMEVTYTGDSNTIHIMGPSGLTGVSAIEVDGVLYPPTEYFTFTGTSRTVKFYGVQPATLIFHSDGANLNTIASVTFNKIIPSSILAGCTSVTDVVINLTLDPSHYSIVGSSAFQECSNLSAVTLTKIGSISISAFYKSGIENVVIPEGCGNINGSSFGECKSLKSVVIPSTAVLQSTTVFRGSSSLSSITINQMTAPANYITGVSPTGTLYVPEGATGYDAWLAELGEGWNISYITP